MTPLHSPWGKKWGKIGERVIRFLSRTKSILLFGPRITVQNFIKVELKLRLYGCVYRLTAKLTE